VFHFKRILVFSYSIGFSDSAVVYTKFNNFFKNKLRVCLKNLKKNIKKFGKMDVKDYELTYYDLKFFSRKLKKFAPQGHKRWEKLNLGSTF
jgi:hypothetical protein